MLLGEVPLEAWISWPIMILTLSSRGFVFPDSTDTLDQLPGPKSLGPSGQFLIWISSAAAGVQRLLWPWISWHRPALAARGFVPMNGNFVFDIVHGNWISSLKIKETDFVMSTVPAHHIFP